MAPGPLQPQRAARVSNEIRESARQRRRSAAVVHGRPSSSAYTAIAAQTSRSMAHRRSSSRTSAGYGTLGFGALGHDVGRHDDSPVSQAWKSWAVVRSRRPPIR